MKIESLATHKITVADDNLYRILDVYLPALAEESILVITSKIVSICQGRVIEIGSVDRQRLIEAEADHYLPAGTSRYPVTLTLKDHLLTPNAGIDESNANGCYILWPHKPQQVANAVRSYLCQRFGVQRVGVIITDSNPVLLRWGVTGVAIAHSGFSALNDYIGRSDLFGRSLRMTKANVSNALAAAAVLVMGEGNEGTPLTLISQVPFVQFQERDPNDEELKMLYIEPEDDLYAALITGVDWQQGGGGK